MNKEIEHGKANENPEAILDQHYRYLVVDPYAVNLIDNGPRKGDSRLSFYSSFIVNTARELLDANTADRAILFSDASLGEERQSTGELMENYLMDRDVNPLRIVTLNDPNLSSTASQVKRLRKVLMMEGVSSDQVLYLAWDYHMQRLKNHLKGHGLKNTQIVSTLDVHEHFEPNFDRQRLEELLPNDEIEQMEKRRRQISYIDRKGAIPRLLQPVLGGAHTLDNERDKDGKIHFMYKPGKARLREASRL